MPSIFSRRSSREVSEEAATAAAVASFMASHRAMMADMLAEIDGFTTEGPEAMDENAVATPERSLSSSTHYTSSTIYHTEYLTPESSIDSQPKYTYPGHAPRGHFDYSSTTAATTPSAITAEEHLTDILLTMDTITSRRFFSADMSSASCSSGFSTVVASIDPLLSKNSFTPHPAVLTVVDARPKDLTDHWRIIESRIQKVQARKEGRRASALSTEIGIAKEFVEEGREIKGTETKKGRIRSWWRRATAAF